PGSRSNARARCRKEAGNRHECVARLSKPVFAVRRTENQQKGKPMPKYVFLFIDDERLGESHSSTATMDTYQAIGKWWEENSKNGYLKGGEELQPTRTATTIRKQNGKARSEEHTSELQSRVELVCR